MEWVASPFSSVSSWLRNQPEVSWIAGRFFTNWTIREAQANYDLHQFGKSNLRNQNENFCLSSLPVSTRMWSILKFMKIVTRTSLIRIFSPCIDCCFLVAKSDSLWTHAWHHVSLPCPSLSPGVCSNSCPLVSEATQLSPPLSPSSPLALNLSQHQALYQWIGLCIRWPKDWSFSFSTSPSNEYSRLISFRIDWLDLLAVQGTLKSLLQHHSSTGLVFQRSAFLMVQHSHLDMSTGKTIALTI